MRTTALLRMLLVVASVPPLLRLVHSRGPRFVAPAAVATGGTPLFQEEFLPPSGGRIVHSPTLAELPNGDLAAAWYGGGDEARRDVAIYLAVQDRRSGTWSVPRTIETGATAQRALHIPVKSVGNPVLFAVADGLRLFFVSVVAGGWSGGVICMDSSPDGVHWRGARRVISSFLDFGMLVHGAPAAYEDGTIALPIYHQLGAKWSAVARVDSHGRVTGMERIDDRRPLLQPWLIVASPTAATALLRYSQPYGNPFCVTLARTDDAGRSWSEVTGTPLVHRDSAVAGALLGDGSILAFYNGSAWDRRDLSVARSDDGGRRWSRPYHLQHDTTQNDVVKREYSYPYVIRTRDGRLHLVYTFQRTSIRHVTFNDAWVRANPTLTVMR